MCGAARRRVWQGLVAVLLIVVLRNLPALFKLLGPPQVILHEVEIRVEDVNERRIEHSAIGARLRHDQPHEEPTVDERLVGAQFFGTHAQGTMNGIEGKIR